MFLKLFSESLSFAWSALLANPLRTILSLLSVTIGIFAIIAVFTLVDSLEKSIRKSMSFLGHEVIYVQKWPWFTGKNYPWYKYINRPVASVQDMRHLEKTLQHASAIAISAKRDSRVLKYENNSMSDVVITGVSYEFNQVADVSLASGRYYAQSEIDNGRPLMIVGDKIREILFPNTDPIGKELKVKGINFRIIGVVNRQGENGLGMPSADNVAYVPYSLFTKLYKTTRRGIEPVIAVKGVESDFHQELLESELRGQMRARRGLKPKQDDNFAINRPEMISATITSIFDVFSLAGAIIGSFSILVGGFCIANIMFVSVRERTNQIGIQKSLGAKNSFILFQFLFEAIFLSLFGGVSGLLLVGILSLIPFGAFDLVFSFQNMFIGVGISVSIGIVAGIVPAWSAARMDPVVAIRTK